MSCSLASICIDDPGTSVADLGGGGGALGASAHPAESMVKKS